MDGAGESSANRENYRIQHILLAFIMVGIVGAYIYVATLPADYSVQIGGAAFTKRHMTYGLIIGRATGWWPWRAMLIINPPHSGCPDGALYQCRLGLYLAGGHGWVYRWHACRLSRGTAITTVRTARDRPLTIPVPACSLR